MQSIIYVLLFFVGLECGAQSGPLLSLDTYLEQVRTQNAEYLSSKLREEEAELRKGEFTLLTRPALIGSAQYVDDQRETGSALQGIGTKAQNYYLGIRQTTHFGLDARLLYNFNKTSLEGVNTTFFPEPEYYTTGPVLELTQPLLRNGFGREIRASKQLLDAQVQALKFDQRFQQKELMADAETAYWRLALARENTVATEETVDRAKRLRSWSLQRAKSNLGNRSDFLQTDAAFLTRSLELRVAIDEEKAAAREFNTMRGIDADAVPESLVPFDAAFLAQLIVPTKSSVREDVKAAEQNMRAAQANSKIALEQNRPQLNLVGTIGWNGRDSDRGQALSESGGSDHQNYTVGIRLDMPLDLGTLSDNREGYRKGVRAAELAYQRKVFEDERAWKNQVSLFKDAREQLELTQQIEKAQREKMNYERSRQSRGLSTTFQVLQFEQDLANARLARIRAQANILSIFAELKTFGGGQ